MDIRSGDAVRYSFDDKGVVDMLKELSSVPKSTSSARKAVRESIKIMKEQAVANARAIDDPSTKESIAKNIKTQARKTRKRTNVRFRLGVDKKRMFWAMHKMRVAVVAGVRKKEENPHFGTLARGATPYWSFVEFGTRHSKATPFMTPVLQQKGMQTQANFNKIFMQELERKIKEKRSKMK